MRRMLLTSLGMVVLITIGSVVYMFVMLGIGQGAFPSQANGSMVRANGRIVGSSLLGQSFTDANGNPLPQYFQPRPSETGESENLPGSTPDNPTASGSRSLGPTDPLLIGYVPGISITDSSGQLVTDASGHLLSSDPFATPSDPYCVPIAASSTSNDALPGGTSLAGNESTLSTPFTGVGRPDQYQKISDGTYACDSSTVPERAIAYRTLNELAPGSAVPVDAVTVSSSGLDPEISLANADLQAPRVARFRHLQPSTVRALVKRSTSPRPLGILGEPGVNVLKLNIALDQLKR